MLHQQPRPHAIASVLVPIEVDGVRLEGQLSVPPDPVGLVIFVHGAGGDGHGPRSRAIARTVRESARAATLLVDLLSPAERAADARTAALRFDISRLAGRTAALCDWAARDLRTRGLPVGLFGASSGAAAALTLAAERPDRIAAVVSRGGRPDLAGAGVLAAVRAPTLLLVGSEDPVVLDVNRDARNVMRNAVCKLEVVLGASHLFEEPGTLAEAARDAAAWFARYLPQPRPS
jgi:putative phosphoribosyl transferase